VPRDCNSYRINVIPSRRAHEIPCAKLCAILLVVLKLIITQNSFDDLEQGDGWRVVSSFDSGTRLGVGSPSYRCKLASSLANLESGSPADSFHREELEIVLGEILRTNSFEAGAVARISKCEANECFNLPICWECISLEN
jgi:hypothetical protein